MLKKRLPSLSLGTIYRNLKILTEEGRVTPRDFGDGIDHYDAIPGLHYHFICDICKTDSDFPMPVMTDPVVPYGLITFYRRWSR